MWKKLNLTNWSISLCDCHCRRREGGERRDWGGRDKPAVERKERDDRQDNGLTEEEREKRLAEKMPKAKPSEGPVSDDENL